MVNWSEVLISATRIISRQSKLRAAALGITFRPVKVVGPKNAVLFHASFRWCLSAEWCFSATQDADFTAQDISKWTRHFGTSNRARRILASRTRVRPATNIEMQRKKELTELNQAKDSGSG